MADLFFQPNPEKLRNSLQQLHSLLEELLLFNQQERFFKVKELMAFALKEKYSSTLLLLEKTKNELQHILQSTNATLLHSTSSLFQSSLILVLNLLRDIFMQLASQTKRITLHAPVKKNSPQGYFTMNYHLLYKAYQELRKELHAHCIIEYKKANELIIDEYSLLFDTTGMQEFRYPSNIEKIRYYALQVLGTVLQHDQSLSYLLEYNVSEMIKNAIRHGNLCQVDKEVIIYSETTPQYFRIIVQQKGQGFLNLEEWNRYYRKRTHAFETCDIDKMIEYACYSSENSKDDDGGNALIAALEFWDSGLVFDKERTSVAALKILPSLEKKRTVPQNPNYY
jgi:serine/threonine-protein kinase RsbW